MSKWIAVFITALLSSGFFWSTTSFANDEAVKAASLWLQKIDGKQLESAYDSSADMMKSAVTADKWIAAITNARTQLGDVQSRDLLSVADNQSFPSLPPGNYVAIQFKTKFSMKPESIESLTFMKETDGQYRVIGYFVR